MTTTPAPARPGRKRTIALFLSLGLNLALIGLIAGVAIRGPAGGGRFGVPVDGFRTIVRAMGDEDRRHVERNIRGRRGDLRKAYGEMRQLRAEFLDALRAQDFSREQLATLFQRQSAVLSGLGTEMQAILVDRIAAMSTEERAALADRLESELRRKPRRRRD